MERLSRTPMERMERTKVLMATQRLLAMVCLDEELKEERIELMLLLLEEGIELLLLLVELLEVSCGDAIANDLGCLPRRQRFSN